jgi:hypothetical protein
VEQIGFFTGLGIVIVLFAAMALGRLSVISVRDARLAERAAEAAATEARASEPSAARATERVAPDAEPANVSADPAAERVDSASAAR